MSYGRSTVAKVSVGRADSRPMRPHTPFAKVHVGESTCGIQTSPGFNDVQVQAWSAQCGPGEKRRMLGTERASVTAGQSATFQFQTRTPFRPFWLAVQDDIASNFSITSLLIGLNQIIVGGSVNADAFAAKTGRDCSEAFEGCVIYPSVPAELVVTNNSAEDLFFEATLMGAALISC